MVLNTDCALQKSEAAKLYRFSQEIHVWIGEDLRFLIVDLTFHGQWQICFPRQPPCSGSFAFLRSHTGFAQSVEVVLARRHNCSSKLCLLFSPFELRSRQQRQIRKNQKLWDSHQLPWFKMVFNRACHCALQKSESARLYQFFQADPGLCWGSSTFLIVDLTFHGQWRTFPVRYQPPCSGSFAFLRSHTGFAQSVEVVRARCDNCSSKLCLLFSPFEPRSWQQTRLRK